MRHIIDRATAQKEWEALVDELFASDQLPPVVTTLAQHEADGTPTDPETLLTEVLGPRTRRARLTLDMLKTLSEPKLRKLEEAYRIKVQSRDITTRTAAVSTLSSINSAMQARGMRSAGGPGSGNFGHGGRPGQQGGSSSAAGGPDTEWTQPVDANGRPIPIKVKTVEEAAELVLQGKVVEVPDARTAYTLIEELAELAQDAKEKGTEAPEYDLCQVSVPGTNMFCTQSLRSKEYPSGVPRIEMPQLGGEPVPATEADALPRTAHDDHKIDGAAKFIEHLAQRGIKAEAGTVPASNLRASQREIVGQKVAKMMVDKGFDPAENPVFISNDNYIVDGHHRWAAVVGRDAEDGSLGGLNMNVIRVDAPISEVLHIANTWSKKFGIKRAAGVKKK